LLYRYAKLGIHWAAALPGFIALACIPFTILFYKYGAQIRAKCKYAADAERQMNAIMAARNANAGTSGPKDEERNIGEKHQAVGGASAGQGDDGLQSMPAESAGGVGNTNVEGREERTGPAAKGKRLEVEDHHLWSEYEALADRDEVDLRDDERIRLDHLHRKFEWRKAKQPSS
jgi:hypothetical protein